KHCLELKPELQVKKNTLDLLSHIWKYKMKPSWWGWWINAPVFGSLKTIIFILVILSVFGLLSIHPFMPAFFSDMYAQISWPLYALLVVFLIFIILSPSVIPSGSGERRFDLIEPPSFEPVLSKVMMKQAIIEIIRVRENPSNGN
ncbi:MAG: hypothetical protein KGY70_18720, partial [Bacteroidales bacterium]|nr:hypothetical protein [Bacteroidales bacterium]